MTDDIDESAEIETHEEWALRRRREKMKVSRPQAIHALRQAGLIGAIEMYVAGATDLERDAWENAVMFSRLSPVVNTMALALGLTAEQLDALFDAGAEIAV